MQEGVPVDILSHDSRPALADTRKGENQCPRSSLLSCCCVRHSRYTPAARMLLRVMMTIEVQKTPMPGRLIPLCNGTKHFSRLFAHL